MPRRITLSVFVFATAAMPALAADLPAHSRIGAVFAEPAEAPQAVQDKNDGPFIYAPEADIQPLVTGYYGKPNSYYHKSYYGSTYFDWGFRLPYACGFYGYC
jgi:hypothetical protein